ncbi:DUF1456 family protein [Bacillus sp. FJAT-45350]|uniref:DUF1456 family protein n=1 Tax=Bacillus sp. FJAT-45350 TaxID=2011014 RepID=UPI000BB8BED3
MTNNDLLIRLRYALDIKDIDMVEIFKLGGVDVTKEQVQNMLSKTEDEYDDEIEDENSVTCNNTMFECFLNGFITFKRGRQDSNSGQPIRPELSKESPNNLLLKKLKIALTLTSEDIIDILDVAGVTVSKGEIGALLRKKGHAKYKECGDKYARNFLKGLTLKYRT